MASAGIDRKAVIGAVGLALFDQGVEGWAGTGRTTAPHEGAIRREIAFIHVTWHEGLSPVRNRFAGFVLEACSFIQAAA